MTGRRCRSRIVTIQDMQGNKLEQEEEVKNEVLRFYKQLLGSTGTFDDRTGPILERVMKRRLNASQNAELIKGVTDEEVRRAMFSINGDNVPGPDG